MKETVVVPYDQSKEIVVIKNASEKGIGLVISHMFKDCYRLIAFISKTLNSAEKLYSAIEKEA